MRKAFLSLVILLSFAANGQKVYSVDSQFDADVKVYVVDSQFDADLLVYRVSSQFDSSINNGKWFFVRSQFDADLKIYFVDSQFIINDQCHHHSRPLTRTGRPERYRCS